MLINDYFDYQEQGKIFNKFIIAFFKKLTKPLLCPHSTHNQHYHFVNKTL